MGGYTWYGNNRKTCKRASGGVGLLVRDCLQARTLKDETEGVLWVKVKLEGEGKVAVGVVYANLEGVRCEETDSEVQFEKAGSDVLELWYKVVVMGDFNAHIGIGEEVVANRNGRRLLNLANVVVGNELPVCKGRGKGARGKVLIGVGELCDKW